MTSESPPLDETDLVVATSSQASTNLDGEAVVLNLSSGMYHGFNEVGTRIWDLVQEPRTVGWIRDRIVEEFAVDPDTCLQDLLAVLGQMRSAELIEVRRDPEA